MKTKEAKGKVTYTIITPMIKTQLENNQKVNKQVVQKYPMK